MTDAPGSDLPPSPPPASAPASLRLLALLAALTACWVARDLLVPVMLAMFLALVTNPLVTRLRRLWIPRWLGALVTVFGGLALAAFLASLLVAPASDWIRRAPNELRQLTPKLRHLVQQVDQANRTAVSLAKAAGANPSSTPVADVDKPHPPNLWALVMGTPRVLASIGAVVLLAFFFLVYGQRLERQAIDALPDGRRKEQAAEVLRAIESEVSGYVLTISLINLTLGLLLTGGLLALGLDLTDALLWGTVAALLNFVPYVGPLIGVLALALVGAVAFDEPARMLAAPAIYLGLHGLESQLVTPIILGRRMAVSPLIMLLWLMLWGWLWGIAGLLLAVPMLVSVKIVASRVDGWREAVRVLE